MNPSLEAKRYEAACRLLPQRLQQAALALPAEERGRVEELRLRTGCPLTVLLPEGERAPAERETPLTEQEDVENVVNTVTGYSRYAALETLRQGYLCVRGGFRIGVCGAAVMREGAVSNLKDLSSLAIRIVRERIGLAAPLIPQLYEGAELQSTLILSAPGGGKTTLLRDLIRCLSLGDDAHAAQRVAVADERGELAVTANGRAQTELGNHTDVLDGCPKALAVPMLLRAMNPTVIAVDEITVPEDVAAIRAAANCGVALLATVHAPDADGLKRKPLWREILTAQVFTRCVTICGSGSERAYRTESL